MNVKKLLSDLFDDESAVSPVIGVILMVAITVILAAVIATFVLGLGESVSQSAPQATFSTEYEPGGTADDCGTDTFGTDGSLDVTHDGGDSLEADNIDLISGGTTVGVTDCGYGSNTELSAGNSLNVRVDSDDSVRVVWNDDTEGNSATLTEWEGPDA
jgi:flagellin-like protein